MVLLVPGVLVTLALIGGGLLGFVGWMTLLGHDEGSTYLAIGVFGLLLLAGSAAMLLAKPRRRAAEGRTAGLLRASSIGAFVSTLIGVLMIVTGASMPGAPDDLEPGSWLGYGALTVIFFLPAAISLLVGSRRAGASRRRPPPPRVGRRSRG